MVTFTPIENTNKVELYCELHNFKLILLKTDCKRRGYCKHCKRDEKAKEYEKSFKEKSNTIHKNTQDYSLVKYIKNSIKVDIRCTVHDMLYQQTPADHLSGKVGCSDCIKLKQPQCQPKQTEGFINQAIGIHKDFFYYDLVAYTNTHTKVKIKCKKHSHIFEQTPAHHLQGKNGCKFCTNEGKSWSKTRYVSASNGRECHFYIIRCFNENEEFIKVGTTYRTIKQRYYGKNMPYSYEIVKDIKGSTEDCWELENTIKHSKILKPFKYSPLICFNGRTECFQVSQEILNFVDAF